MRDDKLWGFPALLSFIWPGVCLYEWRGGIINGEAPILVWKMKAGWSVFVNKGVSLVMVWTFRQKHLSKGQPPANTRFRLKRFNFLVLMWSWCKLNYCVFKQYNFNLIVLKLSWPFPDHDSVYRSFNI